MAFLWPAGLDWVQNCGLHLAHAWAWGLPLSRTPVRALCALGTWVIPDSPVQARRTVGCHGSPRRIGADVREEEGRVGMCAQVPCPSRGLPVGGLGSACQSPAVFGPFSEIPALSRKSLVFVYFFYLCSCSTSLAVVSVATLHLFLLSFSAILTPGFLFVFLSIPLVVTPSRNCMFGIVEALGVCLPPGIGRFLPSGLWCGCGLPDAFRLCLWGLQAGMWDPGPCLPCQELASLRGYLHLWACPLCVPTASPMSAVPADTGGLGYSGPRPPQPAHPWRLCVGS